MSESTEFLPEDELPPVRSGWRRALVASVLLGAGVYGFGQLVALDDSGTVPAQVMIMAVMLGPVLGLVGFTLWWLLLGDGKWYARVLAVFGAAVACAGMVLAAHPSIRAFVGIWGIPLAVGITGLALVAVPPARWWVVAGLIALTVVSPWWALRLDGVTGAFDLDTSYRWKPSVADSAAEQLADRATVVPTVPVVDLSAQFKLTDQTFAALRKEKVTEAALQKLTPLKDKTLSRKDFVEAIAQALDKDELTQFQSLVLNSADLSSASASDWPGFRGANRDGVVPVASYRGWDGTPPRERWRNNTVGPAWSSFCVVGDFLFTQEQRGESESVICYRTDTGTEVWARGQPGKHFDQPSGAGPRATPTYASGRIYAVSASGVLSCLRAASGEPVWTVNLAERFGATKPPFGLSTSPLVIGDLVLVNPSSTAGPRVAALDAASGATRWETDARGTDGYSSPHAATINGVYQVLSFNGAGLFGHDPQTGRELWHYDWEAAQTSPTTVQPLVLPDGRVVIGGGNIGVGTRCVKVRREGDGWAAAEVWKTTKFTPKFNDVVRVGEYLYGLDNGVLTCLNLSDGAVVWKEGRYGAGQVLLVGDKLLVVSEMTGQLACVAAKPDEYEELWKIDVVKGKAWNHPVIARGRLFYRNATVMVALDLPGWTDKE